MLYQYAENPRLQLWFSSPNVCAVFLSVTAVLLTGLFLQLHENKKYFWRVTAWGFVPLILFHFICLAVTYSRGGYVAVMTALTVAAGLGKRRIAWLFPVLFVTVLLLTDHGLARAGSIGNPADHSIRNRLWLWDGGCGVIFEHWLGGTGPVPNPGIQYTTFYQPLSLDETYGSLIGDGLTIAASYGIVVFFVIVVVITALFRQGYRIWKQQRQIWLPYLLAALFAYIVGSLFSTCYRFPEIFWLPISLAAILLGKISAAKLPWRKYDFIVPLLFAIFVAGGIMVRGAVKFYSRPYMITQVDSGWRTVPRGEAKGNIYFVMPADREVIRKYLRPFSENGWNAQAVCYSLEPAMAACPTLSPISGEKSLNVLAVSGEKSKQWAEEIISHWHENGMETVLTIATENDEFPTAEELFTMIRHRNCTTAGNKGSLF